jgi:GH15 family glucan-1,4-alpha-glucosidase
MIIVAGSSFAYIDWPGYPTPDGYPSDPASRIYHWKEEAVVGNQYMTVQLDANGTIYDIYYPSVGFRNGSGTSNEGYKGPEEFIGGPNGCSNTDLEANGQMNVIAGMGGIQIGGTIYWMKNSTPPGVAAYDSYSQGYVPNNNVLVTSNRLNLTGNQIQIVQYDFCPTTNAIPPVATDGVRTNYGVYVKRFLLTNLQNSPLSGKFYFDVNFNVKGDDAGDYMYMDYGYTVSALGAAQTNHTMVVVDNNNTVATGGGCGPDGYGSTTDSSKEYNPRTTSSYNKSASVYFGVCMKEVTNGVTGAGTAFDGSWRDLTATDSQEGWIGKYINFAPNETKEIDVMIVGSWDDQPGQTGTHSFWGRPLVDWFYGNNMATAQAVTQTYWSDWLNSGVTTALGAAYDTLFARSLLVTALHIDAKTGAIIAGMHNGAYPFVWPRDGVYAAITLDRTGHTKEAEHFYQWLRDVAYRAPDCNPGGLSFFYQKYTTDGYFAWNSPQIDETASVPWGIFYHYLTTGDLGFLSNYAALVDQTAWASIWNSCVDSRAYFDSTYNLMNGNSVWEDAFGLFMYSNSSVVRGLRDAANCSDVLPGLISPTDASTWRSTADNIRNNGIIPRVNARVEPADISHLGMAVPYEVFSPTDGVMQAVAEWIHGNGAPVGGFNDNLEETGGGNAGYWRRYDHNIHGNADNYWQGGPWHLATAWYGEYNARWQDYSGGTALVDVNLDMLNKIVARLGPVGLGAEQIAPNYAQKYPGFWHQAAWPNVWESHSTFLDQMMMFLDYKPAGTNNNTCYFAPKLPSAWTTMSFSNLNSQGQHFHITVSESLNITRADLNKLTSGSLGVDIHLRIPAGTPANTVAAFLNGTYLPTAAYDAATGRVHIQGSLSNSAGNNAMVVTYGTYDSVGEGIPDWWRRQYFGGDGTTTNGQSCATCDPDGDGFANRQEYQAGTVPTNASSVPLRIISLARQGNDVVLTWTAQGGKTNVVLVAPSTANGSYSNNFGSLSSPLPVPGIGLTTMSYTDVGGATNVPSRFYRVGLITAQAADDASDPAYSGGWTNGSNGGVGFGPWTLTASGVMGSSSNGYLLGASTTNAFGASPGIDAAGKSWGIYANGGNFTAAYRTFANGPLQVGQSFLINIDNGFIDAGDADGFVLRNGNAASGPGDYNTGSRFEFLYLGGDSSNSYKVVDSGGLQNIGVPFTGTGLRLVFTLTGTNTYSLTTIDNASGATNTFSGTLAGSGTLDSLAIYNRNSGSGADHDAFLNSLQIINP